MAERILLSSGSFFTDQFTVQLTSWFVQITTETTHENDYLTRCDSIQWGTLSLIPRARGMDARTGTSATSS
jgi:hypothetical protein